MYIFINRVILKFNSKYITLPQKGLTSKGNILLTVVAVDVSLCVSSTAA